MNQEEAIRLLAADLAAAMSDGPGVKPIVHDPYLDGANYVLLLSDAEDSRKWMKVTFSPEMLVQLATERAADFKRPG